MVCKSQYLIHFYNNLTMERTLNLFDRINIAHCATKRAYQNIVDEHRFHGEFCTARAWNKYKCYITTSCQFVEPD